MRKGGVALLRRPISEPLFMTHPSEVGSTSQLTLLAAMLLDTRCRTLARRRVPRSWSQLACALAWTVLATCSLRTSSRLRRRSTLRTTKTCCARTTIRGRRRSAVLTLSSPSHTARTTRALLGEVFRETLVWPALSPDLSPYDCALWVYGSLSSFRRTQRTSGRCAQPSSRPTRRSPVTRSSA